MKRVLIALMLFIMPVSAYACDYCAKATIYQTKTSAYHIIPISVKSWEKGGVQYVTLIMWEEHSTDALQKRLLDYSLPPEVAAQVKTIYTQLEICLSDKEYRVLRTVLYNNDHVPLPNGEFTANLKWLPSDEQQHIKNLVKILEKQLKDRS